MSDRYAAHRRSMISLEKAWAEMPPAGDPDTLADIRQRCVPAPESDDAPGPSDTSYLYVIDRHGKAFSATPSDGSDKTPIIPGVGVLCSGRGTQSWADHAHPCSVAPGKRPRLTPNPAMALRNGRVYMPFGTPVGDVQCQAMLQVFLNVNVFGMSPQPAFETPRFAGYSFPGSFEPHPDYPGRLHLERASPRKRARISGSWATRCTSGTMKPGSPGRCAPLSPPTRTGCCTAAPIRAGRPMCSVGRN
jgi:gamma-glutamyltranspeptidase/glutathione hydrolase